MTAVDAESTVSRALQATEPSRTTRKRRPVLVLSGLFLAATVPPMIHKLALFGPFPCRPSRDPEPVPQGQENGGVRVYFC